MVSHTIISHISHIGLFFVPAAVVILETVVGRECRSRCQAHESLCAINVPMSAFGTYPVYQKRHKDLMNCLPSLQMEFRLLRVRAGRNAARLPFAKYLNRRMRAALTPYLGIGSPAYKQRANPLFGRAILPIALSFVLTGCALLPAGRSAQISANEPTPTPIPTSVVPVKPTYSVKVGEILRERTFSGRVAPVVEEALFFRTGGRIRNVYAKRNEIVTAGQIIADLEIDDLERELTSTQLNLERAQSRLYTAERNLEFQIRRAQISLDIATLQLINLRTESPDNNFGVAVQNKQIELAEIALEQLSEGVDPLLVNDVARAHLQVEKLQSAIADATITAPFDGKLLSVSLTAGRPLNAFDSVVSIADITDLEVKADLISDQMNELAEEMTVEVSLVGRPGEILTGFVRRLPYPFGSGGSGAVIDPDKSTRITIDQEAVDVGFELGDLVQVRVQLEQKDAVLWLPPQAIRVFDGRRFVVIQDGDIQRRVDVKVGIQTPDRVEIEDGLEEGQVVVGQ